MIKPQKSVLILLLASISMIIALSLSAVCLYASGNESMLVFVTSKRYDGDLGGVKGANEICQNHAKSAGLPGEYKAWISSSTEQSPIQNFNKSTRPYTLKDTTVVANNWEDFTSGQLLAAIGFDENGLYVGFTTRVWTGTTPQGENLGKENCKGWQSNEVSESGWVGIVSRFWTSEWSVEMTTSCDEGRNLYCIQQ